MEIALAVYEADARRGLKDASMLSSRQRIRREEIGEQCQHGQCDDHQPAHDGDLAPAEPAPDELEIALLHLDADRLEGRRRFPQLIWRGHRNAVPAGRGGSQASGLSHYAFHQNGSCRILMRGSYHASQDNRISDCRSRSWRHNQQQAAGDVNVLCDQGIIEERRQRGQNSTRWAASSSPASI